MTGRLTITDVAKRVGVTTKTLIRWEKSGKIRKPKRDWKGWRFYVEEDLSDIQRIVDTVYDQQPLDQKPLAELPPVQVQNGSLRVFEGGLDQNG